MRNTFLLYSVFAFLAGSMITSCRKKDGEQIPTIIKFSPESGKAGDVITIEGVNFSAAVSGNVVKFNNTTAEVTEASATIIKAKVPAGATSGKITVTTASKTAVSTKDFTVLQPPAITGFSPGSGLVGQEVTITGTNFSASPSANEIRFNGVLVTEIVTASAVQLKVKVPAGATTGKIKVKVNGTETESTGIFQVKKVVTYVAGYETVGGFSKALYWKDKTKHYLPQDGYQSSEAYDVFIDGAGDVYICGWVLKSGSTKRACYWKNGTLVLLEPLNATGYSEAKSIYVTNNIVHCSGYYNGSGHWGSYWKTGVPRVDLVNSAADEFGHGLYASGTEALITDGYQGYWKIDGAVKSYTKLTNSANANTLSVEKNGSDIVVAGKDDGKACFWKNAAKTDFGVANSHVNDVLLSGTDIYCAGFAFPFGYTWKNNASEVMIVSPPAAVQSECLGINRANGLVYIAGRMSTGVGVHGFIYVNNQYILLESDISSSYVRGGIGLKIE